MQGRTEKEFPAPDFPATHFMACRNLPIPLSEQQDHLTATPCPGEQPYKNKPGHSSQHQPSQGTCQEGKHQQWGENTPKARGTALS